MAITFVAPSSGSSPIAHYEVSLDNGATWRAISVTQGSGSNISATISDLSDGTAYTFRVRAVNIAGPGGGSDPAGVTPGRQVAEIRDITNSCLTAWEPNDDFQDVVAESAHDVAIDCLVRWGVVYGVSATSYDPLADIDRAQMASLVARLILRSGGTLPAGSADPFDDDDTSVHQDQIEALTAAGIVTGTAHRLYSPGGPVTRAQMATVLVRALEYRMEAEAPAGGDFFSDDDGDAHEANTNKAATAGFTGGIVGSTYGPALHVHRDQAASYFVRLLARFVQEYDILTP